MGENKETDKNKIIDSISRKVVGNGSFISKEDMAARIEQTGHNKETLEWINKLLSDNPNQNKK